VSFITVFGSSKALLCGVSALAERETTPVSRQNMISQVFEFCEKMNVPHEL
jgi:hypothetical protein